jgi:hypothetical protein
MNSIAESRSSVSKSAPSHCATAVTNAIDYDADIAQDSGIARPWQYCGAIKDCSFDSYRIYVDSELTLASLQQHVEVLKLVVLSERSKHLVDQSRR